jgi:hypothetical protein
MPPQISFTGYITSVIDHRRVCVRVDQEHVEKISTIISNYSDRTTVKDTLVVNLSDARFAIGHDWEELTNLVGIHVKINASLRRYSYWRNREQVFNEDNERHVINVKYKGVSIIASRVISV